MQQTASSLDSQLRSVAADHSQVCGELSLPVSLEAVAAESPESKLAQAKARRGLQGKGIANDVSVSLTQARSIFTNALQEGIAEVISS